ncbi:Uncharacterized conserved protein YbjT, contains NAD(P)-binding and DUF2867 domains [Amycolatopsis sacchari]|uniref:Uncharacterized conserved protein YbjT, contains NAD(P)-binding and DUF2867 domains n=1 Tax=Amycolatopsis sacchari TaxID=115433 RepID=A0A1I3JZS7_9PSEU|nr:NAD(P)H-binding protein [Amycolatopsis sacchari]SFI65578.1 Uncharacterized conserved protein YbjT, contains NAD(P)-binding and DUF2867 domains [Amycolatopsis sacchari]
MIVVTTPTGAIGRQVVRNLLDRDERVRVVVRDPGKLSDDVRERVEVVPGSHGDLDVVTRAFDGADAVFWLVPPDPRAESIEAAYVDFSRPAYEAIKTQGVGRVVGVSSIGRGTPVVGNAGHVTASIAMDDLLASTGVPYRSLANATFMDNLLRQVASIRDQGVFYDIIAGDTKAPTCATRDIAAVATGLLTDPTWSGYDSVPVLGPEDLSQDDLARTMSEVLGKPVRYQRIPAADLKAMMIGRGTSEAVAQAMIDMMTAKDNGLDLGEPDADRRGTPTTFRQWCEEVLKPAVES